MKSALIALVVVASLTAWHPQLTTGTVHVAFTERGRAEVTAVSGTIYFEVPGGGNRQRRVANLKAPVEMDAMPLGRYRLTAVAQSMTAVLVASTVQEFEVDGQSPTLVFVDLVQREGTIRVVDNSGLPVSGAHYYTRPSAVNSTADEDGGISLALLATGTELTVRTIQWGMTCHRVTAAPAQTAVVPDATDELVIVAPTTPTSGLPQRRVIVPSLVLVGATVSGLPGADCAIPYEHFPVTLARRGAMTEHTMLLPPGSYRLALRDGRTLDVRAPGRVELSTDRSSSRSN